MSSGVRGPQKPPPDSPGTEYRALKSGHQGALCSTWNNVRSGPLSAAPRRLKNERVLPQGGQGEGRCGSGSSLRHFSETLVSLSGTRLDRAPTRTALGSCKTRSRWSFYLFNSLLVIQQPLLDRARANLFPDGPSTPSAATRCGVKTLPRQPRPTGLAQPTCNIRRTLGVKDP